METNFRFNKEGELIIKPTPEADAVKANKNPVTDSDSLVTFEESFNPEAPGDTVLQWTQYKGKTFQWLLINDPSFVIYLARDFDGKSFDLMKTEREKTFHSLVTWAFSFQSFKDAYEKFKQPRTLDGRHSIKLSFGNYKGWTFSDIYESKEPEHVNYIASVLNAKIRSKTSSFSKFKTYIKDRKDIDESSPNIVSIPDDDVIDSALVDDVSISSSKSSVSSSTSNSTSSLSVSFTSSVCSPAQKRWMYEELFKLGLIPGQKGYNEPSRWQGQPLFRAPPPPEMQAIPAGSLPKRDPFCIHPLFVWFPTKMLCHLMPKRVFPCREDGCRGEAKFSCVGKARVVVGSGTYSTGMPNCAQYYVVSSELSCTKCSKRWQASDRHYMRKLPDLVQSMFPAHIGYRSMVCKSIVDLLHRGGRSISEDH